MTSRRLSSVVVLAAIVVGWVWLSGRAAEPLPLTSLDGYRVVYRIEDRTGPKPKVRREIVEVRRPFDGRVQADTPSRRGTQQSGRVSNREHLWLLNEDGDLILGALRAPAGPTRDGSYAAMRDAASAGLAEIIGSGRALGRTCTWFVFENPPPEEISMATEASRYESCIDASGIVLREVWTASGRTARVTDAIELSTATPDRDRFLYGSDPKKTKTTSPEASQLLGTQFQVVDNLDPGPVKIAVTIPKGWKIKRSSIVAEAVGGQGGGQGARPSQVLSEGYVRGGDLVVVERSTPGDLAPTWERSQGAEIKLPRGKARIVYFIDRVEVRLLSKIGYARVTAPSKELALLFANGLREPAG